jgi:hypothetical protein
MREKTKDQRLKHRGHGGTQGNLRVTLTLLVAMTLSLLVEMSIAGGL